MKKSAKIIDVSLLIDNTTTLPPSQARKVSIEHVHMKPGFLQVSWLSLSAHTATHVDSPLHVVKGAEAVGGVNLEKLIGEAVILNLTSKAENSAVTSKDLEKFKNLVHPGDIILLRTDWTDKKWGQRAFWTDSPFLSEDGARWLVERKPKALGFDFFEEYSARLKDFKPRDFRVHNIILHAGILIVEGLTNLGKATKDRVRFIALPLKLTVSEASPARAVILED